MTSFLETKEVKSSHSFNNKGRKEETGRKEKTWLEVLAGFCDGNAAFMGTFRQPTILLLGHRIPPNLTISSGQQAEAAIGHLRFFKEDCASHAFLWLKKKKKSASKGFKQFFLKIVYCAS